MSSAQASPVGNTVGEAVASVRTLVEAVAQRGSRVHLGEICLAVIDDPAGPARLVGETARLRDLLPVFGRAARVRS